THSPSTALYPLSLHDALPICANGNRTVRNVFPHASASYRFTDLGDLFNEVKLRGGWGRTGNRPRYADRDVVLNAGTTIGGIPTRSEEHTSELQSLAYLVCRLL